MYFEQFYLTCLSHASYMLGSEGLAAVVDPQRDVALYLEEAARHHLEIRYVIETHLHADFVSGHQELAARTGAEIYVGAKAGARFPHVAVRDGQELTFGHCRLQFLETPGHTLESISVVVTDLEKSPEPFAVLTGDTLFIGDVGRPDLSDETTPQQLAGLLFDSLHEKLLRLPDSVQVFPAHGAGSLCGRQMSAERSSTIGKEKLTNYALRPASRGEFVELLTADLPQRPKYFAQDVELNRAGAAALTDLSPLAALTPDQFLQARERGAVILDTRPSPDFAAAHIPGSLHIALGGQFASWAGILLGLDTTVLLLAEDPDRAAEARMRLARVGIENVDGYLMDGIPAWIERHFPVQPTPQISVGQLHQSLLEDPGHIQVLDVRRASEWQAGHIAAASLHPLDQLERSLGAIAAGRPVAVHCKGGYRSAIAASVLQRAGFEQVFNVTGGYDAWVACGLPVAIA